ncbi:hypothetical protein [Serratia marcescens]|uniref:hypothetical protein n=1 Tax=Serratia marcescens TaxID=615 RepID=UPI00092AFC8D|nr:hypothetical protein [Serratia marcescens]OJH82256.1 hypothetical protein ASJ78_04347 [Serratia marcescens]
MLTTERQQFAEQNEMSLDFVNWFFDEKKESFGNMWFLMAAALWEGWKGRANREAQPVIVVGDDGGDALAYRRLIQSFTPGTKLYTAPPTNAKAVGYFLRYRAEWHSPSKWSAWAEIDEATYDNAVKIIATGEADAGRFYEARILYDAPPAPAVPAEMSLARAIEIAWKDSDIDSPGSAYRDGWNACRAAMLAQPVSGGYTLASGCQWTYDEMDFKWDSSCGESWQFIDGGPSENGVKFCQGCGKPVLLAAAPEGGNS